MTSKGLRVPVTERIDQNAPSPPQGSRSDGGAKKKKERPQLSDEEKARRLELARQRRQAKLERIDPDNLPEVLTVDEAAILLRLDPKTVRELFHAGQIPGRKLGPKIIRFHRDELLEWVRGTDCVSQTPRRPR